MTSLSLKDPLTERQRQIAALIADDLTNGEIAERLGISLATTKHHVSELLARLELPRREVVGDWYQARYRPGLLRRLRAAIPGSLLLGAAGAGVAVVAIVVVVLALLARGDAATTPVLLLPEEPPARGHLVAYTVGPRNGPTELCVRDLNTGEGRQLIDASSGFRTIRLPRWTPDGEALTFVGVGEQQRLYRVTLNRELSTIDIAGREDAILYSWSPQGDRLAVIASVSGERRSSALWLIDPGGALLEPSPIRRWRPCVVARRRNAVLPAPNA